MGSKVVLITGCSSGIGRASARRLARAGHRVYATARRNESVADLRPEGCNPLVLDVTHEESMRAAVSTVLDAEGRIDVLVNNAGYAQSGAVETLTMESLRRQFETNVFGLVRMCQLVLPSMRSQGSGRIVNVSSMGANFTFPGGGAYHATKYAVDSISDALRFEVKGFGIDVVIIQPGLIRTSFGDSAATATSTGNTQGTPYDGFNAYIAKATTEIYESGLFARLGGPPEAVAKTVERAIAARRPKLRYRVTPSAKLMVAQRRLTSAAMWDRLLAMQFSRPGNT